MDPPGIQEMRALIRSLADDDGVTVVLASHQLLEVQRVCDRVAILNQGAIEQVGTPDEVHDAPAGAFVAGFVGEANRFAGEAKGGRFTLGDIVLRAGEVRDGPALAFVRPHELLVTDPGKGDLAITVAHIAPQGAVVRIEGATEGGQRIEAAIARQIAAGVHPGARLELAVSRAYVFPA